LPLERNLTGYTRQIDEKIFHFITGKRKSGKAGHGDIKIEAAKGQIAVSKKDLQLIPFITKNYDSVRVKKRGGLRFVYEKIIGDKKYIYVESVGSFESKVLRPKTMYIEKIK
jgi:hypothetical protein